MCIFRKDKEERKKYEKRFCEIISKARQVQESKVCENRSKRELRVDPILPTEERVQKWFDRSLEFSSLLLNSQLERRRNLIMLMGTCSADSILQALTWLYIDDVHFRETIDALIRTSSDAVLARLIAIFAQTGNSERVYRLRRIIMSKNCSLYARTDIKYMQCDAESFQSIEEFVAPLFPVGVLTSTCKCLHQTKFATLPINHLKLGPGPRLTDLQQAINKRIHRDKVLCKRCGEKDSENQEFSDFVFIHLGSSIVNLFRINKPDDIPKTIDLNGQKYVLVCFLDDDRVKAHAMLSFRRKNGKWYHYDDNEGIAESMPKECWTDILLYKRVRGTQKSSSGFLSLFKAFS